MSGYGCAFPGRRNTDQYNGDQCGTPPISGAVAAVSGHINVHETGAIEATGHKVLPLPSEDGKIAAAQVEEMCHAHWTDGSQEHMVQPGMVYISHPTENGTLYTKKELADLHEVCRKYGMLLFLDGARLGYGLMAETNDITLADLAKYTDVFYIGGTKVGALFGEAVVITNRALKKDFRYMIKQNGGMLAKDVFLVFSSTRCLRMIFILRYLHMQTNWQ